MVEQIDIKRAPIQRVLTWLVFIAVVGMQWPVFCLFAPMPLLQGTLFMSIGWTTNNQDLTEFGDSGRACQQRQRPL